MVVTTQEFGQTYKEISGGRASKQEWTGNIQEDKDMRRKNEKYTFK